MREWEHLGDVTLKSNHSVYHDGSEYRIDTHGLYNPDQVTSRLIISEQCVGAVRRILAQWGRQSIAEVATRIGFLGPFSLGFVYDGGQQLEQEVERALIVLAVKGEAQVNTRRRPMVFWLSKQKP